MIVVLIGFLFSCRKIDRPPHQQDESADVVYAWYKFIANVQRPANPQPVVILNLRNFAFIGVGLYEAVRPGNKGAESLSSRLYQMPAMPQADIWTNSYLWSESANAALASMFKLFLAGLSDADKASIDSMENANYNRFRLSTPDAVLVRSQAFGRAIATAIYNWSITDNFNLSSVGYVPPPLTPSSWIPTPPAFATVGPFLKDSRPFLESSLTAIAPPPVPFSEDKSSQFYQAAKEVYDIGKNLTAAQKATAEWWADAGGSGIGVPSPHHPISLITWVQENQKAKLWQAAEVYAKTGIAIKDGGIITFKTKYHYNLLRPVTYIKRLIDSTWTSYLPNPPYPEYTSGLAGFYSPLIQVLIREYGDIPVTDNAYDWRGLPARKYKSLSALLEEAAFSRIYAGIHYRFTQEVTIKYGKILGNEVAAIRLVSQKYKHP
jgi:hypothetical protein